MEPYHRQPPAKTADSKLKTAKRIRPPPHIVSSVQYPPQQSPRKEKPVQSRHPSQASTQINSTGPTLHKAEPHTEGKYDPARQENSQGPSSSKINRTRDKRNKCINTHTKHHLQMQRKKKIPPGERQYSKKRKTT
jgi:hypothetical protein